MISDQGARSGKADSNKLKSGVDRGIRRTRGKQKLWIYKRKQRKRREAKSGVGRKMGAERCVSGEDELSVISEQ